MIASQSVYAVYLLLNDCSMPHYRCPPGCDKIFVEDVDGDIPCQDDQDCPQSEEWWLDVLDEQCTQGRGVTVGKCSGNKR